MFHIGSFAYILVEDIYTPIINMHNVIEFYNWDGSGDSSEFESLAVKMFDAFHRVDDLRDSSYLSDGSYLREELESHEYMRLDSISPSAGADYSIESYDSIVNPIYYRVWYGTNRECIHDDKGDIIGYSVTRSDSINYGSCKVYIPKSHVIGSIKSPMWRRWLRRLIGRSDDRELTLKRIYYHSEEDHWREVSELSKTISEDKKSGLVFIHGYNVSFEEAAIRSAQMGFDLNVQGPVGFFSWPSRGSLVGYAADEAAIEASEEMISRYLIDFATKSGLDRVNVIAHSMGNRGLLRAIQRLMARVEIKVQKRFAHFILAAPDVDRDLFLSLAGLYGELAQRTTLYVSDRDRALAGSQMLRIGAPRAGLAPPITIAPGIDTVHVANVDLTLLGHGYVAEAREVLTDIHQLLVFDAAPEERMGLSLAQDEGQPYWIIRA